MTNASLAIQDHQSRDHHGSMHGSPYTRRSTGNIVKLTRPFSIPQAVVSTLWLDLSGSFEEHDARTALARAKRDGVADLVPALADEVQAALTPVDAPELTDRLTLLGMSMANGKSREEISAWLHETTRLLADLPKDILFDAIDECVKEPGRVFIPSVGEIREKAAGPLRKRERHAARLRRIAMLIAEGVEVPPAEPERPWGIAPAPFDESTRCTPEDAAKILAEVGLSGSVAEGLKRYLGEPRKPTRADYIAMGVDPVFLDRPASTDRSGEMPC